MLKHRKIYIKMGSLMTLSAVLLMYFQNCAPPLAPESLLASLEQAVVIDQIHSDNDHGTSVPSAEKQALIVSKSMLDRVSVYSLFIDIFGPEAKKLTALIALKKERAIFGGACSVYDSFRSAKANLAMDPDESEPCLHSEAASDMGAGNFPTGNVLQQAIVNDACKEAVEDIIVSKKPALSKTYLYILAQLKEKTTVEVPGNTTENILKLFRLFYRGKPEPDQGLVEGLQFIIGEKPTHRSWKDAIMATCQSSHWQAL